MPSSEAKKLIEELRKNLLTIQPNPAFEKSNIGNIYTAFIFSHIVAAARDNGLSIKYEQLNKNAPSTFIFRNAPGRLHSTRHQYTYARITSTEQPCDLHIGVRFKGKSGVLHECDISLIPQSDTDGCTHTNPYLTYKNLSLFIECKYRTTNLSLDIGRSFIGLATEFSESNIGILCSNKYNASIYDLLKYYYKPNSNNISLKHMETNSDSKLLSDILSCSKNNEKRKNDNDIRLIRLSQKNKSDTLNGIQE